MKIFYEAANLQSTVRAANKLGYVQSNISKRIAGLETVTGRKLFDRSNRGITLTYDGERFLSYVTKILNHVEEMEAEFLINRKQIRIGATQAIARNYLQQYYYEETITVFIDSAAMLYRRLLDCRVDFIITNKELKQPGIKEVESIKEKLVWTKAIDNHDHPCHNKVIVSRDSDCPYRMETYSFLDRNAQDTAAMTVIEVDTMDLLVSMLETNKAVAVLPEVTVNAVKGLEAIAGLSCHPATVHVYALSHSSTAFTISLTDGNIFVN